MARVRMWAKAAKTVSLASTIRVRVAWHYVDTIRVLTHATEPFLGLKKQNKNKKQSSFKIAGTLKKTKINIEVGSCSVCWDKLSINNLNWDFQITWAHKDHFTTASSSFTSYFKTALNDTKKGLWTKLVSILLSIKDWLASMFRTVVNIHFESC